ncbi:YkvA family protein [Streptomyces sp. GC420]|uniref:YkvA family protein n=1 Tax=Streptomyces sp. GC420 TaxID=2697568 RepID=UPI001414E7EF|nr:YkvA family protein [Streptomyces sp. GC420]NBM20412.1 DUF1232 domain-containing protein [Streptomyces sp. GC420]
MSTDLWVVAAVAGVLVAAMLALAVTLVVRMVRARRTLRAAGLPLEKRALFWGAVVYLVSPVDLLPDPMLLDDIGVLLLALRSLNAAAARVRRTGAPGRPPVQRPGRPTGRAPDRAASGRTAGGSGQPAA